MKSISKRLSASLRALVYALASTGITAMAATTNKWLMYFFIILSVFLFLKIVVVSASGYAKRIEYYRCECEKCNVHSFVLSFYRYTFVGVAVVSRWKPFGLLLRLSLCGGVRFRCPTFFVRLCTARCT